MPIWLKNRGPWFTWWFNQLPGKPIYFPKKDNYAYARPFRDLRFGGKPKPLDTCVGQSIHTGSEKEGVTNPRFTRLHPAGRMSKNRRPSKRAAVLLIVLDRPASVPSKRHPFSRTSFHGPFREPLDDHGAQLNVQCHYNQ